MIRKKLSLMLMLLLTVCSLIMGIYDGGDCTAALIFGLLTVAIARERGHAAENNPVNCFQAGLSNESCDNKRKLARVFTEGEMGK